MEIKNKFNRISNVLEKKGMKGLLRLLSTRLFSGFIFLQNPFDFVEKDTINNLHNYLNTSKDSIGWIIIVGAHKADEVLPMRKNYKHCRFSLFEASPRYSDYLEKRFRKVESVEIYPLAVGDVEGLVTFYETSIAGSGSLQKLGELAVDSYGVSPAEEYSVACETLDGVFSAAEDDIDCLWIDVQGAESRVLDGATKLLKRAKSVFIEISIHEPLYECGAIFSDISKKLEGAGFVSCSIGTDYLNGTGNAFFVKKASGLKIN